MRSCAVRMAAVRMMHRQWPLPIACFLALCFTVLAPSVAAQDSEVTVNHVPTYIAVLPVNGKGTDKEREDVRVALHNILSSTNFRLRKPAEIDQLLASREASLQLPLAELAELLQVDGILIAEQTELEKVFAAAYAHYQIGIKVQLYDARSDSIIWDYQKIETEREGGVSLDPLSFLVTAYSSSQVVQDVVRLQLIDAIARNMAGNIPQPEALHAFEPVQVSLAASNAGNRPFRSGEEIRVVVETEPGLNASFSFSHQQQRIPLLEKDDVYQGSYIVRPGDDVDAAIIELSLSRDRERPTRWQVPGTIAIDTSKPDAVQQLGAVVESSRVALSWQHNEALSFRVERADSASGNYRSRATVSLPEFNDESFQAGQRYRYRVTAIDAAGNESKPAELPVATVRYGPTDINSDLKDPAVFNAVGSPYRIRGTVLLLSDLVIEAGALLEFAKGAELQVLGSLKISGSSQRPVLMTGEQWRLTAVSVNSHLVFDSLRTKNGTIDVQAGDIELQQSRLQHTTLSVADQARLQARQLELVNSQLLLDTRDVALRDIRFEQGLLRSQKAVQLEQPIFASGDYLTAMTSVQGPVAIKWPAKESGKHLQANWFSDQWRQLAVSLQQQRWPEAQQRLDELIRRGANSHQLQDVFETLFLVRNPLGVSTEVPGAILQPRVKAMLAAGQEPGLVWLSDQQLAAAKGFKQAYLQSYFPKAVAEAVLDDELLALESFIEAELKPEYGAGVLFLINKTPFQQQLKQAGYLRVDDVLAEARFIQPRHHNLCLAADPWVLGQRAAAEDARCLALTVSTWRPVHLMLFAKTASGKVSKLYPCRTTEKTAVQAAKRWHIPRSRYGAETVAQQSEWSFDHYYLVAVEQLAIPDLLQSFECGQPQPLADWPQSLSQLDRSTGGLVQWQLLVR